jgi:tRNA-specific 2-thiouridylase
VKKKVVLGLSGGVDSLVSALLLQKEGYEVMACSFKLYNNEDSLVRAADLAKRLGIAFRIIDLTEIFKQQIIDPFINDYLRGATPSPCVWCNDDIKAHFLYEEMNSIGADFFATGHYINIKSKDDKFFIHKGKDENKDQSYFLWHVKNKYLKHWLTPLGAYLKSEVKQIAVDHKMGFLAHRKESMSICFLGKQTYPEFIQSKTKEAVFEAGEIVSKDGVVIGQHKGLAYYTIGQKKGLNLNDKNLCVVKMDANNNRIYVGYKEDLFQNQFYGSSFYFVDENEMFNPKLKVIVRGIGINPKGYCKIQKLSDKQIRLELEHPAWALAKGQPMAFYVDDRLLGGAYYSENEAKKAFK